MAGLLSVSGALLVRLVRLDLCFDLVTLCDVAFVICCVVSVPKLGDCGGGEEVLEFFSHSGFGFGLLRFLRCQSLAHNRIACKLFLLLNHI